MKLLLQILLVIPLGLGVNAAAADTEFPTAAQVKIVRITESGFLPRITELTQNDGSVFFYNDTGNSIEDFSVKFGTSRVHCHNPSLRLDDDGVLRASRPIIPKSFAIACFPDSDTYAMRAKVSGKPVTGSIIVSGG